MAGQYQEESRKREEIDHMSFWAGGSRMKQNTGFFRQMSNFFKKVGFTDYIDNPCKLMLKKSKSLNLDGKVHSSKVLHGLWLTNENNPRGISHLKNFMEQSEVVPNYQIIIWTNIDPAALVGLNPELKGSRIIIRNISEINTSSKLLDIIKNPSLFLEHDTKTLNPYGGLLVDITKYLILESEGGIMADMNFRFGNDFNEEESTQYDFVIKSEVRGLRLENGFIVAKPHHIISQKLLESIEWMLFGGDPDLKDALKYQSTDGITELFSMIPLAISYFAHYQEDGNIDVLFSNKSGYKYKCSSENRQDLDIESHNKIVMDKCVNAKEKCSTSYEPSYGRDFQTCYWYFSIGHLTDEDYGEQLPLDESHFWIPFELIGSDSNRHTQTWKEMF